MKIPNLFSKPKKKKLRATTARRSMAAPDEIDYEEMSEPNMKLSRALLIVLVLHVVAVAGIIAFNTIKSRQVATSSSPSPQTASASAAPVTANTDAQSAKPDAPAALPMAATPNPSLIVGKVPPSDVRKAEPVKAALPVSAPADSGNFYVVAKGDNPVKIAKKLKVSESELLAANHIDDPRKLQIGQKLIVPASKQTKAKAN